MVSRSKLVSLTLGLCLCFMLNGCIDGVDLRSVSSLKGFGKLMLPRFIAHGANSLDVAYAQKKLDARPTDNWVAVWSDLGKNYEERCQRAIDNNNLDDAQYLMLKASVYYRIAGYPYPIDEGRKTANEKGVTLFQQYLKFLDNPPQPFSLSMETKRITGYIHRSRASNKTPLIIILPGLDWTKEECYWFEEQFMNKGFSVATVDTPGAPGSDWPLRNDSMRMLNYVIEHFKNDNAIDNEKIVVLGFNLGAYWALRLGADSNNGLAGVIAVSPPVHETFAENRLSQMPRFLATIFKQMTGAFDLNDMYKILGSLSLEKQDVFRDIRIPAFVIASEKDFLVPYEDALLLAKKAKRPITLKLYTEQPFGIIENLQSDVYPMLATWAAEQCK